MQTAVPNVVSDLKFWLVFETYSNGLYQKSALKGAPPKPRIENGQAVALWKTV